MRTVPYAGSKDEGPHQSLARASGSTPSFVSGQQSVPVTNHDTRRDFPAPSEIHRPLLLGINILPSIRCTYKENLRPL